MRMPSRALGKQSPNSLAVRDVKLVCSFRRRRQACAFASVTFGLAQPFESVSTVFYYLLVSTIS